VLHFRERGEGEPLVLLHPGPGLDGSVFFPWFERLADRYRVIAPDLPGNGRSPEPADWSFSGLAAEVEGFADELGLGTYSLLGHSFGGFVALTHAVERPDRLDRLVVSCSAASHAVFDDLEDRLVAFEPSVMEAFEAEEHAETPEQMLEVWLGEMPFFVAEPGGPAHAELEAVWRGVDYRLEATQHDPGRLELLGELPGVSVPMLAIAGAEDRTTPAAASRAIADAAPRCRCVVIEDAAHFAYAERPDAYFAALGDWLSETG
jgi:proline iminopeptidase